jgi:hypothetical protein
MYSFVFEIKTNFSVYFTFLKISEDQEPGYGSLLRAQKRQKRFFEINSMTASPNKRDEKLFSVSANNPFESFNVNRDESISSRKYFNHLRLNVRTKPKKDSISPEIENKSPSPIYREMHLNSVSNLLVTMK